MLYTSQTSQGPRSFSNFSTWPFCWKLTLRPGAPTVPLPPYPQRPPGHPLGGVPPIPQLHFGATHGAYPTPVPMIPGMGGMGPTTLPPPIPRPPTLSGYLSQTPPPQMPQPQVPQHEAPQAAQNVPPPQESPTSCAKDRTEGASNGERLGIPELWISVIQNGYRCACTKLQDVSIFCWRNHMKKSMGEKSFNSGTIVWNNICSSMILARHQLKLKVGCHPSFCHLSFQSGGHL